MDVPTNKKKKLNSKNPKYTKKDEKDLNARKELVGEVNGVKISVYRPSSDYSQQD